MPFTQFDDSCGVGLPLPSSWRPIDECECLILVGLTGVGKTTVLTELEAIRPQFTLLPNRRELTDVLMIPMVQRHDSLPVAPVTDRQERFALTRRYRELHPGGMAHALSSLAIAPQVGNKWVIFDGLRGENEIQHAATLLPNARFLMLDTPELVRIQRLVARRDAFDQIGTTNKDSGIESNSRTSGTSLADYGLPDIGNILTESERQQLVGQIHDGLLDLNDVRAKMSIVLTERENYDPAATRAALRQHAPERSLILDTDERTPKEIAAETAAWLQ